MFCPKCGNKEVVDIFCKQCLKEEKPLVTGIKDVEIQVCLVSKRVRYRNRWVDGLDEMIHKIVVESIVPATYAKIDGVTHPTLSFDLKPGLKIQEILPVVVTGKSTENMNSYSEEYDVPITINVTISPPYNKMGTSYFEATLQVRNETKESKKLIQDIVQKHNASIAKEQSQPLGTDYYISSKVATDKALYALLEKFGGLVKTSRQLFSYNKQQSKDIYRITDFISLPPYKPGDVIEHPKGPLLVVNLGKRIRFTNLATKKTAYFEYKDAQCDKLTIHETRIAQEHPQLLVLHPENFTATKVENATEVPETVRVVIYKKKLYLV